MENQKDNSIKDIRTSLETMEKSLQQSARRAGNIVTALYIVSNVLPDGEPLQKEIRQAGLNLLSTANDIAGGHGGNYDRKTSELNATIKKIISFLEVGVTLFLISEMNFRILRLELLALGGSYESRRDGLMDIESILKFDREEQPKKPVHSPKPQNSKSYESAQEDHKGHLKDNHKGQNQMVINVLNKPLAPTFGSQNFFKDKSTGGEDRKNKIINTLKQKTSGTIADIKANFPDVSFKTIQRDLQALIDEGKVQRMGERRWSMYRLKDNHN